MKDNLGSKTQRKKYGGQFKAKVALSAIRGEQTANEIASLYGVHPVQVAKWKGQLLKSAPQVFDNGQGRATEQALIDLLYRQVGKRQVENEWLKKNLVCYELADKRNLIDPNYSAISVARQCELVGLARSSLYYQPVGLSREELEIMRLIDEQYTRTPFYGRRRMRRWLKELGWCVAERCVARLMKLMRIEAIYPKPRTSTPLDNARQYPYLLKGLKIVRPNQVWGTDITYVRLL